MSSTTTTRGHDMLETWNDRIVAMALIVAWLMLGRLAINWISGRRR